MKKYTPFTAIIASLICSIIFYPILWVILWALFGDHLKVGTMINIIANLFFFFLFYSHFSNEETKR